MWLKASVALGWGVKGLPAAPGHFRESIKAAVQSLFWLSEWFGQESILLALVSEVLVAFL